MLILRSLLRRLINFLDECFDLRKLIREEKITPHPLAGDRAIEWSWIAANLPSEPSRILDLGCVGSALSGIASRLGHCVTAVDLNDIEYEMPRVMFRKGDINKLDFADEKFDTIMNCSMIEHVGLENRYGSEKMNDGDLIVMEKLNKLLTQEGRMILTIPVGVDASFVPFHRIYGVERLPRLISGYNILSEEFYTKSGSSLWHECDKKTALATQGSPDHYSLGLFLLEKQH